MPKETINWPQPTTIHTGSIDDEGHAESSSETVPPGPRIQIHWDSQHGTVQLSMDMDWDVLQHYVDIRRSDPAAWRGEDEGAMPNRAIFYTEGLDRGDLQRLVKHTRRARDAAFGADE